MVRYENIASTEPKLKFDQSKNLEEPYKKEILELLEKKQHLLKDDQSVIADWPSARTRLLETSK